MSSDQIQTSDDEWALENIEVGGLKPHRNIDEDKQHKIHRLSCDNRVVGCRDMVYMCYIHIKLKNIFGHENFILSTHTDDNVLGWWDKLEGPSAGSRVLAFTILLYSIIYSDIHLYQTFTFSIHLVMCVAMEGPRHYSVEKGHVCLQKWIIEGLMGVTVECWPEFCRHIYSNLLFSSLCKLHFALVAQLGVFLLR